MVAYKRLTIYDRDTLYREMCRRNRQNNKIHQDIDDISHLLSHNLNETVPDEVKDFAKKWPKTINMIDRMTVSLQEFYDKKKVNDEDAWRLTWPDIKIYNYIYGFHPALESDGFSNWWGLPKKAFVEYIAEKWPDLMKNIKKVVEENLEIIDWEMNLKCVLNNINTLNQLKNEFPEAYDVYVWKIGLPKKETKKDKCKEIVNSNGETMCDVVEKLRATYAHTSTNK